MLGVWRRHKVPASAGAIRIAECAAFGSVSNFLRGTTTSPVVADFNSTAAVGGGAGDGYGEGLGGGVLLPSLCRQL